VTALRWTASIIYLQADSVLCHGVPIRLGLDEFNQLNRRKVITLLGGAAS